MKNYVSAILAALMLLSLAACSLPGQSTTPSDVYTTGSDVYTTGSDVYTTDSDMYATDTGADLALPRTESEDPAKDLPVTDSELADFGELKTQKDVMDYALSVLPTDESEDLIPYAAAIRVNPLRGWEYELFSGFCTRDGKIITRPVFAGVGRLEIIRDTEHGGDDIWSEDASFCYVFGAQNYISGSVFLLSDDGRTFIAAMEANGRFEEIAAEESSFMVRDAVTDDGRYYIADCGDGSFAICRKDGGEVVALTDIPDLSLGCFIKDDEWVYFTFHGGYACTWDSDFNLIVKVRQVELPDNGEVFARGDGSAVEDTTAEA